ncbi:NAD(P)/FAD-dependent oxidoreductase [Pontibacter sp. BT310]|uniref:NAD(P)/FAD-dependent oxidoreductase n=1 Tax=Pontibacter populi TaxID=890055 RepID=A0ABS6XGV1_9BACT|nr:MULTISPECIES: NAD(P)/FAD-dependent oxidoreductase [Pontibacter]MBJ6119945.1 NAD(P)/FAD-dependent oxidoreductase [Pontibacter sp. BT310]MBR0572374.1 NAD(P)/FAD-dependent oxidoreductase [Microvirga sp. STS03]MBW3366798.1 NAD(P)/FAD-dependent oxidoreductase [Pontibacter populi]
MHKSNTPDWPVIVVGGGLAGLTSALFLAQQGIQVLLIEKKAYPFHRVCGEYVSNEVLPYLKSLGADINQLQPARINRFQLTAPSGYSLETSLDLGGFGISRYTLDNYLHQLAEAKGVTFKLNTAVQDVVFRDDSFLLKLGNGQELTATIVIGAYGKRATLDRQLDRHFFAKRSPYIGVKYHVKYDQPKDIIALHNFKDGYAGISAVENDTYCFCYLTTRHNLKEHGTIAAMEQAVLYENPHLHRIFTEAEFLYAQPEVINEISFATKTCIENHMLMCGDAAGMITPLCGNGMAMAIHAGKLAAEHTTLYFKNGHNRQQLVANYSHAWNKHFANRLQLGRTIQHLFGHPVLSEVTIKTLKHLPSALQLLMRQTHGQPF